MVDAYEIPPGMRMNDGYECEINVRRNTPGHNPMRMGCESILLREIHGVVSLLNGIYQLSAVEGLNAYDCRSPNKKHLN
jgi:hypothetical protein